LGDGFWSSYFRDADLFRLQTAPASTGTFTNLPSATNPHTNPLTAAQQCFRLKKN